MNVERCTCEPCTSNLEPRTCLVFWRPVPPASPPAPASEGPRLVTEGSTADGLIGRCQLGQDRLPFRDDIRRAAVDIQPCQRFTEDRPVREGPPGPWIASRVAHPTLQAKDLAQSFDVAACQRQ